MSDKAPRTYEVRYILGEENHVQTMELSAEDQQHIDELRGIGDRDLRRDALQGTLAEFAVDRLSPGVKWITCAEVHTVKSTIGYDDEPTDFTARSTIVDAVNLMDRYQSKSDDTVSLIREPSPEAEPAS